MSKNHPNRGSGNEAILSHRGQRLCVIFAQAKGLKMRLVLAKMCPVHWVTTRPEGHLWPKELWFLMCYCIL